MNISKNMYLSKSNSIYQIKSKSNLLKYIWKKRFIYLILLFPLLYCIIFNYIPMYGVLIAFQKYIPGKNILTNQWIGLKNFEMLFESLPFLNALKNTLIISIYRIFFGFPIPIILALLLNEARKKHFKMTIQTIIYFPYFVSWIIVGGILLSLLSVNDGLINQVFRQLGLEPVQFMSNPEYFRTILVVSGIWKEAGWGTVIYLAALSSVNVELYEAAVIDGANRWQQTVYITIPEISSTIAVLFILSFSNIMSAGFDQIFILLNPMVTDVGEIIDTYVYKVGLKNIEYSLATAVGLFKGVIAFLLLTLLNSLSKRIRKESIY